MDYFKYYWIENYYVIYIYNIINMNNENVVIVGMVFTFMVVVIK